ncbi:MAG: 16S rRNA (cytidine(1402)-2'-O)-methyltransferase [Desulfosoma sp.]|uniref:16S rRNA (cytidine(1402)-2'-O)-methyltransferase n=1 Tax=Desulfosoma sp. TaxID=2603217 RepID=UPI00404B0C38
MKERGRTPAKHGAGTLYVVATPIGNLQDITLRALEILRSVGYVVAEDTRHTRKLLTAHQIRVPILSFHAHTSAEGLGRIVDLLKKGAQIALVTDAGTPGISDPGVALIQETVRHDLPVVPIPGPSAAIAALIVSGLASQPFAFLGFPPSRGAHRTKFFLQYASLSMTRVLYESPRRLPRTLQDILDHWGNLRLAVARELTKVHEQVFRGTVSHALDVYKEGTRGEVTLVVEGAPAALKSEGLQNVSWKETLQAYLDQGDSLRHAVEEVQKLYRVRHRDAYQAALHFKRHKDEEPDKGGFS